MLDFWLNFVFPRVCFGCGKTGNYLCALCIKKLDLVEKQTCPVCQKTAIGGQVHPGCSAKKQKLDGLFSLWVYRPPLQTLVKAVKYRFAHDIVVTINELVRVGFSKLEKSNTFAWLVEQKPTVIPVPLAKQKQNWRGFNQAELIAQALVSHFGLTMVRGGLLRTKNTVPQSGLDKTARKENIIGAFIVPRAAEKLVKDMPSVILVDDIWASGATLNECARVLKKAGVKRVWAFTLAR